METMRANGSTTTLDSPSQGSHLLPRDIPRNIRKEAFLATLQLPYPHLLAPCISCPLTFLPFKMCVNVLTLLIVALKRLEQAPYPLLQDRLPAIHRTHIERVALAEQGTS